MCVIFVGPDLTWSFVSLEASKSSRFMVQGEVPDRPNSTFPHRLISFNPVDSCHREETLSEVYGSGSSFLLLPVFGTD